MKKVPYNDKKKQKQKKIENAVNFASSKLHIC